MKNNAKLTILQINDTHGYLDLHWEWMAGPHEPAYRAAGGFARVGTLVRKIREETQGRVLFCDNGDTFHGTHPIVHSRGEILMPILKYRAAYLTMQGVPQKYGRKRQDLPQHAHEAMLAYLDQHKPASAELRGTVVAN